MTLRLVAQVTRIIALFLVLIAVFFAIAMAYTPILSGKTLEPGEQSPALARGIADVPHPVDTERFINCENCHAIGARRAMPDNHRTFSDATCSLCHLYPPPTEQAEQAVAQEVAGKPPYTFGWTAPIDQRAAQTFDLPDACAVGATLEQIVMQEGCSLRADGATCVACHNAELPLAGVHLDDLAGKQDFIERGYVARFVRAESAKPVNLKLLFSDWQARGYPD